MEIKIAKRLTKFCSICGRQMRVIVYSNKDYRGGHFFGRVSPAVGGSHWFEYWECPKCYWKG